MTETVAISPSESGAAAGLVFSKTSGRDVLKIEVDRYSQRAKRLKKTIITGARCHVQEAQTSGLRGRWAMLTTTYRPGCEFSPRDISGLLKYLRRFFCSTRLARLWNLRFRYLWCLELTKAGKPHYHVLIWLPRGMRLPKPDKRGWWLHGLTRIEWARNAVGYLAKYASKFTGEAVGYLPKGARTHGVGGLGDESRRELRWWKAPLDAREALGPDADIRKVKGGYADKRTGEFWPSPWRVYFTRDGRIVAWRYL